MNDEFDDMREMRDTAREEAADYRKVLEALVFDEAMTIEKARQLAHEAIGRNIGIGGPS